MKKFTVLFLVFAFCTSMLVGCGQSSNSPTATTSSPSPTASSPSPTATVEGKMKVAFVYDTTVGDYGWYYGHDKARKLTQAALDFVETTFMENVLPGAQAERVLTELANNGFEVIITASSGFEADVLKVAEKFPNVKFLSCCGVETRSNVETFYPLNTQLWYMLGQIAGKLTKTNVIGMIGASVFPIDLQIQNAWLLGAQSVNPDVTERIIYINTYYDPAAERDAALALIDAGADILCQATNTPAHVQAAEEMGVYAMSQYEDMSKFGPKAFVSGEMFFWEKYYIPTLQAIRDGSWKARSFWPDIFTGVAELAPFGSMVTDEMKAMVAESKEKMKTDPEFFWKGPIKDVNGKVRVEAGKQLTREDLLAMDWWVQGTVTSMTSQE
jgi:basic membrane protein A